MMPFSCGAVSRRWCHETELDKLDLGLFLSLAWFLVNKMGSFS